MSDVTPLACPRDFMDPLRPDTTIAEAQAAVRDFAGVEPVITRTELWRPGEAAPGVRWRIRIVAAFPEDLERTAVTLRGAVEQLRAAVGESPGWRKKA